MQEQNRLAVVGPGHDGIEYKVAEIWVVDVKLRALGHHRSRLSPTRWCVCHLMRVSAAHALVGDGITRALGP